MERIARESGRRLFGGDAHAYDGGRPDYPERVYDLLVDRCGLGPRTRAFEVGAGTGHATRHLAALGARPVVAIEPDAELARYLDEHTGSEVEVRAVAFEDAELAPSSFDLGVSATAFHWIDARAGLGKVADLLGPGGWWAMWWTVFGDPDLPDPFHEASQPIVAGLPSSPSHSPSGGPPFALDTAARIADLERARAFEAISSERIEWILRLDPPRLRALYATYSPVTSLPPGEREAVLDALYQLAEDEFAGSVERRCVTAVYTARRAAA